MPPLTLLVYRSERFFVSDSMQIPMEDGSSSRHRASGALAALLQEQFGGSLMSETSRSYVSYARWSRWKREPRKTEQRRCPCRLFSLAQDADTFQASSPFLCTRERALLAFS